MPAGGQTTKTRARSSGSVKPGARGGRGSRSKGRIGKVRIKRGPRKGTVVNAYIYPNGTWWEIKNGQRTGGRRKANTGRGRIKPKYSAASMRARARRKQLGLTFGKSHKRNVRRNNTLRRFAPRAAVPHTRTRRSLQSAGTRRPRHLKNARSPSRHRGGNYSRGAALGRGASAVQRQQRNRRRRSSGRTTRRGR